MQQNLDNELANNSFFVAPCDLSIQILNTIPMERQDASSSYEEASSDFNNNEFEFNID